MARRFAAEPAHRAGGMSSAVHIDELNPETRAKVLQQIGETQGTTVLAVSPAVQKSIQTDTAAELSA